MLDWNRLLDFSRPLFLYYVSTKEFLPVQFQYGGGGESINSLLLIISLMAKDNPGSQKYELRVLNLTSPSPTRTCFVPNCKFHSWGIWKLSSKRQGGLKLRYCWWFPTSTFNPCLSLVLVLSVNKRRHPVCSLQIQFIEEKCCIGDRDWWQSPMGGLAGISWGLCPPLS